VNGRILKQVKLLTKKTPSILKLKYTLYFKESVLNINNILAEFTVYPQGIFSKGVTMRHQG
jgi:hypothetical protein